MTFHVLVVDDNDINLLLVTKILELEGYKVTSATNGIDAIRSVSQNMPDLAILDLMMPNMNGFELCQKLRQSPINASFPIVMLTAMNSEIEKVRAKAVGADDVMSKPFDMDLFRQRISVLLAARNNSG
jgi:CheY-like chemotaxis protein